MLIVSTVIPDLMDVCQFHITLQYSNGCLFTRYLAVVTSLASEADFVFIPEAPPSVDWRDKLCDKLEQASCGSTFQSFPHIN